MKAVQFALQNPRLTPVLLSGQSSKPFAVPWVLRLAQRFPILQGIPACAVGVGVRPERVRP